MNCLPNSNKYLSAGLLRAVWCVLFLCQFGAFEAFAQVNYVFTREIVDIKGGETFSNLLRVVNLYQKPVTLTQNMQGGGLTKGLISLPDTLRLGAGETRTFPVKYVADRQTINSNRQVFAVQLTTAEPGIVLTAGAKFIAQMGDVSGLSIGTEDDEVYLSQLSSQAQVVVRCANNGFVPLTFRILLTGVPDGLEFTGQTMNLTLEPGAQQLLPFVARNRTANSNVDFTVTMQALDAGNHQLAVKVIRVLNVTSVRRMSGNGNLGGGDLPNTVSLHYATLNRNSSFYQLQANGKMKTGDQAALSYRLNADDYHQTGANGINIYNSYLDYQTRTWGLKVGSIFDNLDFQLSGKGVKASAKMDDKSVISFYGVENNYFLYNQTSTIVPGAKIFALDYDLVKPGAGRKLTFLHSSDPMTALDANQVSSKADFKLSAGQTIGFEAGYSLEKQSNDSEPAKQGFSGGMSYVLHAKKYDFSGSGYYSSPYFTGLRRGLLFTDLRLARKLGSSGSLLAHVNMQENKPEYQDRMNNSFNLGINKNAIYIYELGYSDRINRFYFNLGPYYMDQHLVSKGFADLVPVPVNWKSRAVRFAGNIGYTAGLNTVSLTADYGYTYLNSSAKPPAPFSSLKVTGAYTMPLFGFTGYLQLNPFYLSDALAVNEDQHYRLYSFGPNIHFNALKNKLSFQASGMYNYYGFTSSNNYSASGSFRYMIKGHWAVTGDAQYMLTNQQVPASYYSTELSTMNTSERQRANNRQFRLGIEKQFGREGNQQTKKLQLAYYEDHNNNGQRDPGEPAIAGVLVKINNEVALTNSRGEVTFSDMKKDEYSVTVTNTRGWSLQEPTAVFLDRNKKMEVPMVKTQALTGCLKPVASKYLSDQPSLAGIRVTATDANGIKHQTMTDGNGAFCFYLPRNSYTVVVETEGMPFSIANGKEEVVLQGAPVGLLTFLYRDEHRKVGVTRF